MSKIGKVIDGLEPDALRRILDAPLEAWAFLRYSPTYGDVFCARCFVGHVLDLREHGDASDRYLCEVYNHEPWAMAMRRAEVRILNYGVDRRAPRLIRAIKIRALKALDRGSSQEFEGLPRREMRPTTLVSSAPKAEYDASIPGRGADAQGAACTCDEPKVTT